MYQMTVRGIKKILAQETEQRFTYLFSVAFGQKHFLNAVRWDILTELGQCETYEALDDFIDKYCKMSLQEWIDSL